MFRNSLMQLIVLFVIFGSPSLVVASFDQQHGAWDAILSSYVVDAGSSSQVRYAELKANRAGLDRYLAQLSAVPKADFETWQAPQKLAFLINAYNGFTLQLIINHYPVESIKDIGNFFRSSWRIEFIDLLGERMHLDHIEHELIRGTKGFAEPRIHFALVCASIGCPKLQAQAFTAEKLDGQLAQATQIFLHDQSRNRYTAKEDVLDLSPLFKWYAEDFVRAAGSVSAFVAPHLPVTQEIKQRIANDKVELEYTEYDWSLNDSRR